ncbi:type II secretion system F family protein [Micromonospora sp. NPDC047762]|uniref:type II secretion system F family protein n=1 Tax=Micromonospora sp. NPDC047762 TaxID=3364255 RepID=UPI0037243F0F
MAMPVVLLVGLLNGLGLWLIVDGIRRRDRDSPASVDGLLRRAGAAVTPVRAATVIIAAVVSGLVTGWLVGAILAGLAAWSLPTVLVGNRVHQREQEQLEAIAGWTESLRDTLAAAAGLEEAIAATAGTAPAAIRPQVIALSEAIDAGVRLPVALRAFAADLDHPTGDMVVASLLLAATRQARNLAEQLGALAATAREQAAARMRIQTEWATTRTSVRIIIAITLVMAVGQVLLNRTFLAPYDTLAGQVVLAIVGAMFAVGFIWLSRMSRIARDERVLAGAIPHPQVVTR